MNVNVSLRLGFVGLCTLLGALAGCGGGGGGSNSGGGSTGPITPTITWAKPAAISYPTPLSATQLNATADVAGTFSYTPAVGTILKPGAAQSLSVSFIPSDPSKANSATATNTIDVNKGAPVITWATPAAVSAGTALGATQLNASASVPGKFTYAPVAGTVMQVSGTTTLGATFTPDDAANYATATAQVSLSVTGPGPSYAWNPVKIVAGGYITGLYFHPKQPGLMFARTDVGGAYRWGPGDTQWVPLTDFTTKDNWFQLGVEALGMDPTNPDKLYLAVGEYALENWDGNGAMLVSSDRGKTFTTVALPFKNGSNDNGRGSGERIAVDPNQPSIVYFGTRIAGLQISTDSGLHWDQVAGLPVTSTTNGNGVVAVLPMQSSGSSGSATPAVYAAVAGTGKTGDPGGLYVSTNAGAKTSTWTAVTGQPSYAAASTPLAPLQAQTGANGDVYILYGDLIGPGSMTKNELWKFTPSSSWTGGTWKQMTLPNSALAINNSNGYGGIAVDPAHPGRMLLGTLDQYWPTGDVVYLTTDDGATWRDVSSIKLPNSPGSASPALATHDDSLSPWLGFGSPASAVSTGNWPSAIAIDPFNSAHAMYGTGQTIWATTDLTKAEPSASSTGIVDWTVGADGVEETVVTGLWAPPSGKTLLLSGMGDITGFAHQDLTVSPAQQMFQNPQGTPASIDFAQQTPTTVVRTTDGTYGAKPLGTLSTDGGLTWTGFATMPAGTTKGGGSIAISADTASIVWAPADTSSTWYSKDGGKTWTASAGLIGQAQVVSDKAAAGVFYALQGTTLLMSTDGGVTFTSAQTSLTTGTLVSLPDVPGDLLLAAGTGGLWVNSSSTSTPNLKSLTGVGSAYHAGFGVGPNGSPKPTLYIDGQVGTQWGVYRSTDAGQTWVRINDDAHQWGGVNALAGDMRTFGTVYIGTPGRGIVWGTSKN